MIKKFYLMILIFSFSSVSLTENLSPVMKQEIAVQYETCNCTNNTYTQHLAEPYKTEIQTWLLQTGEKTTPLSQAFLYPSPQIEEPEEREEEEEQEEEEGMFDHFIKHLVDWWNLFEAQNWFEIEENKEPQSSDNTEILIEENEEFPSPDNTEALTEDMENEEPPPSDSIEVLTEDIENETPPKISKQIIHPLCFQMGRKLINNKGSAKQFFSCIHSHYDGSKEDHLCQDLSNNPLEPKPCMAFPISCQDVQNSELTCPIEVQNRSAQLKTDGCNYGASYPRRPCFNQIYTAMTMKAFYDIAECLEVDEHLAFPLFFHESRFTLNIRSKTGALCYAQITGNAVSDINSILEGNLYTWLQPLFVPEKCPAVWKHFQKINTKKSVTNHIFRSPKDRCRLNMNPYTCLIYGMGYLKILESMMKNAVHINNTVGRISRNNIHIILWDLHTVQDTPQGLEFFNIFNNKKKLIDILTLISYNGGPSIGDYFKKYMSDLKETLKTNENLRVRFLHGELDLEYFKDTFTLFLQHNYTPAKRRSEVSNFLNKITQDISLLNQFITTQYPDFQENLCPSFL